MSGWTLCIDFGTAFSKAAAAPSDAWSRFDPASVRPLMLNAGVPGANPFLLPSALFVDEERVLFGRAALSRADETSENKRTALRSFKTILSAGDLERALNTNAPASVDPHRVFQIRDLLVLYLAYLLAAIERAARADSKLGQVGAMRRRFAAPAWRGADPVQMHASIARLFGEAEAFRAAMGEALLDPAGVTVSQISTRLPKALSSPQHFETGLIFEAAAAAAYTSIGLEDASTHLAVLDIGAGTTDIDALARDGERMIELPDARITLKQAGDFLDRVIVNRAIDMAKVRGKDKQTEMWSALMANIADTKETLFAEGEVAIRHGGRAFKLTMKDIERQPDFKVFAKALEKSYARAVNVVCADAKARKQKLVHAVAVGGGAGAPFVQALIQAKRGGRPKVAGRPATPDWAHAAEFQGNLAPVFPQLAIAIGGALAPDSMLAARG